jgi:hypothetical protein
MKRETGSVKKFTLMFPAPFGVGFPKGRVWNGDGAPDARMVLLKGFGPDGFRFFTNLGSAKAGQLEATPSAALILYWRELDRQVRIRGGVEKLPAADDDAYFSSRSRDARIGAWASPQSQPIADRAPELALRSLRTAPALAALARAEARCDRARNSVLVREPQSASAGVGGRNHRRTARESQHGSRAGPGACGP